MNGGRFVGDFADCGGRARGSGRSGDVVDGDRFAGGVSGKGRKWRSGLKWRAGVLGPLTGVASDRGGAVDGEGGGRERVDVGSGSGAADGAGGGSLRGAGRRGEAVECRARGARRGCGAGEPPPCNSANGGSFRRRFHLDLKRFMTARVLGFSAAFFGGSRSGRWVACEFGRGGLPISGVSARVVSARNYRKNEAVQV